MQRNVTRNVTTNNRNNNNTQPSGDALSWLIVLICLFAAFPLGVILLLVKLSSSAKNKSSEASRTYQQTSRQAYRNYQAAPPNGKTGQQYGAAPPFRQAASNQPGRQNQQYQAQAQPAPAQPAYQYYNVKNTGKNTDKAKAAGKQSGKGLSALLMFLGIVFLAAGTVFLTLGLGSYAAIGFISGTVTMAVFSALFYSSAVFSFIGRGTVLRRFSRFNKYAAVIGDREAVPITEISGAVGHSAKKTRKTLQSMIDSGYFGPLAYIDSGLDSFVVSQDAAEKARHKSDSARASETEKAVGGNNQYVAIINELHMLRGKTIDPVICEKIQRIEELTAKIFRIVEDKPEKAPQIRRFMNYYLPTTLKLLHSYETLEKQGVNGENIMAAKQDIERILDTLATGYEQQLDNLFRSDAIDISADIDVLENMMERDGLTNENNILRSSGGN